MGMNSKLKPVTVVINCVIRHDKLKIAKQELYKVIGIVLLKEKACKDIHVHEDPENPNELLIIEQWKNREIFVGAHMRTQHMIDFLKLAEAFLEKEATFTFWNEIPLDKLNPVI